MGASIEICLYLRLIGPGQSGRRTWTSCRIAAQRIDLYLPLYSRYCAKICRHQSQPLPSYSHPSSRRHLSSSTSSIPPSHYAVWDRHVRYVRLLQVEIRFHTGDVSICAWVWSTVGLTRKRRTPRSFTGSWFGRFCGWRLSVRLNFEGFKQKRALGSED